MDTNETFDLSYDPTIHAIYIDLIGSFRSSWASTKKITDSIHFDYNTKNELMGLELFNVDKGIEYDRLPKDVTAFLKELGQILK